jgi:DNA mismatch endonuclease (patch repair protein)
MSDFGTPPASSADALGRMRAMRQRDTAPELAVRSELHRRGLRFYVDRKPIPSLRSRADIVFPRRCVAVYIHGCFWHGCPEHGTWPKANAEWWRAKIEQNQIRDRRTDHQLKAAGWTVVHAWAHEPPGAIADEVLLILSLVPRSM